MADAEQDRTYDNEGGRMKSDSATTPLPPPLMTHSPAIAGARCAARRRKREDGRMGAQRAVGGRARRGARPRRRPPVPKPHSPLRVPNDLQGAR